MKKFILVAAVLFGLLAVGSAELVKVPEADTTQGAFVDYGGVMYSTANFGPISGAGVAYSTVVASGRGVFYGIQFSTGLGFVDVWDSTSSPSNLVQEAQKLMRLYNVNGSTETGPSALGPSALTSGFVGPPRPVRFTKGLYIRASTVNFNTVTIMFYRKPD